MPSFFPFRHLLWLASTWSPKPGCGILTVAAFLFAFAMHCCIYFQHLWGACCVETLFCGTVTQGKCAAMGKKLCSVNSHARKVQTLNLVVATVRSAELACNWLDVIRFNLVTYDFSLHVSYDVHIELTLKIRYVLICPIAVVLYQFWSSCLHFDTPDVACQWDVCKGSAKGEMFIHKLNVLQIGGIQGVSLVQGTLLAAQ